MTSLGALLAAGAGLLRPTRVAVTGTSMAPGLLPGDRLLARRARRYAVGDLVVVPDPRRPERLLVKRLAGRAGDRVRADGRLLEAGPGAVIVLGDHPAASTDSRALGPLPEAAITGRCVYRYAPPARAGRLRRGQGGPGA